MDHLHKNQKNPKTHMLSSLWGHGNDLGDSQLENGKVQGAALRSCLESFQNDSRASCRVGVRLCKCDFKMKRN